MKITQNFYYFGEAIKSSIFKQKPSTSIGQISWIFIILDR